METLGNDVEKVWSVLTCSLSNAQKDLLVEGLQSLLHRNWFKRVWVIQEAANAQVAEIACGITLDPHCELILQIIPGPLRGHSWWAEKPDLYTVLVKFSKSEATDPRDNIFALLGVSSDAYNTDLVKANYEKELEDVIFTTALFLLKLNELDPPSRFFSWTLPEFFRNLNELANEVLKCAIDTEQEALARLLIVRDDVNVNINASGGQTPLSWTARNGHEAIVKLLLKTGRVDVDSKDTTRRTPLSWATENGHEAVMKLLLETDKVDVDRTDDTPRAPFSWVTKMVKKAKHVVS